MSPQTNLREKVEILAQQAINNKIFPGIEILLSQADSILFHESYGKIENNPQSPHLAINSLFDLASLTKPLATTSAILHLFQSKRLNLNSKVCDFLPEFYRSETKEITIKHLLTHTSGLPDWSALYDSNFDQAKGWEILWQTKLQYQPETDMVYSCLGFILLGETMRRVSGISLAEYCRKFIFLPLGLNNMTFNPDQSRHDIIPTAYCPLREKRLKGIVHDENAYLFNGEGGNSGLFGTAQEIHKFCLMLLQNGKLCGKRIFTPETVNLIFQNQNPPDLPPRTLGWDFNTGKAEYMSCGNLMPVGSIGHLGFTGTSLWIDPTTKLTVILLSNRVNISREANILLMRAFRPQMHNLLLSSIPEFA